MRKTVFFASLALATLVGGAATAQDIYVRGGIYDWGTSPAQLLVETAPGSGLFSATLEITGNVATPYERWKFSDVDWNDANTTPGGGDYAYWSFRPATTGNHTFYLQTNEQNDGFLPDAPFGYSTLTAANIAAGDIRIVGTFQDTAFDYATGIPITVASVDGDGNWTVDLPSLDPGTYALRLFYQQISTWPTRESIDPAGQTNGDGNFSFIVADNSDTVSVSLNPTNGRVRVVNDNPAVGNPGPPFYAISTAWGPDGLILGTETAMSPNATANGVYFARTFTVPTAGTYQVKIAELDGSTFPGPGNFFADPPEGGTPFTTTTDGQEVVVIYDTGVYADGYEPSTGFVVVLGAETAGARTLLNTWNYVRPACPLVNLGAGPNNFNPSDPAFNLDHLGNQIWRKAFTVYNSAVEGAEVVPFKAVLGYTATDSGWQIQAGGVGGANDAGLVERGPGVGNGAWDIVSDLVTGVSYTFTVDGITGRVALQSTAAKAVTAPERNVAYFNGSLTEVNDGSNATVSDWTMY